MSDFSEFDDFFSPSEPKKFLSMNDLPDGQYEFTIKEAKPSTLGKTGEKIVEFSLLIARGPMQGSEFYRTYFFRNDMSVNMFGADLVLLGLPAQTWTKEHGKKFSVEMPKALPSLKGKTFSGSIKTTEKDGRSYKNLRIGSLVNGAPKVAMPAASLDEMPF
jgi:hypothetical protein